MTYILNKIKHTILYFIIFTYIVLEEIIWDRIAQPIYDRFKKLHLYRRFLYYIEYRASNITVLTIYIMFFIVATILGLISGPLAVYCLICGIITYTLKIILIAIPFAILKVAKEKLFYYTWFRYLYDKTLFIKHKIQNSEIYINIINRYRTFKEWTKRIIRISKSLIKRSNSKVRLQLKILYRKIKERFKKYR